MDREQKVFVRAFAFALLLAGLVLGGVFWLESSRPPALTRLAYYKLYFGVIQALGIGLFASLLGTSIPAMIGAVHSRFERLKESRLLYSKAKTGLEYLPLRLSLLKLEESVELIQAVHVEKHQAELYEELAHHLRLKRDKRTPAEWGSDMYNGLFDLRSVLEKNASCWNELTPVQRLALLHSVRPSVRE